MRLGRYNKGRARRPSCPQRQRARRVLIAVFCFNDYFLPDKRNPDGIVYNMMASDHTHLLIAVAAFTCYAVDYVINKLGCRVRL